MLQINNKKNRSNHLGNNKKSAGNTSSYNKIIFASYVLFWMAVILVMVGIGSFLVSCEQVFTYSPLSDFARDPANLSPEQKVSYTRDLLGSGKTTELKKAYDALKEVKTAEAQLLASKAATEAAGFTVPAILKKVADLDEDTDFNQIIKDFGENADYLAGAVSSLLEAEKLGATPSSMDYVTTAAVVLVHAAATSDDIEEDFDKYVDDFMIINFDDDEEEPVLEADAGPVEQAVYFVKKSGKTQNDLEDLFKQFSGGELDSDNLDI